MKTTSNDSGADRAERYFNEHFRGPDGKVLWDKVREVIKDKEPGPIPEWLIRLRASNNPRKDDSDSSDKPT